MVAQAQVVVNVFFRFFKQENGLRLANANTSLQLKGERALKIGVISDTHGAARAWDKASKFFQGSQLVLHAGDVLYHGPRNPLPEGHGPMRLVELMNNSPWPIVICQGNCDAEIDLELLNWPVNQPYALLTLGGMKILLSHGQVGEAVLLAWAEKFSAKLVVSGHTHQSKLEKRGQTVFLNPGSPALPKGGPASVATVEDGVAKIIAIDDGSILAELAVGV
jgi:putative phosphoesterase